MSANLKGWNVGIIGFRTDDTDNPLEEDGYQNISVSASIDTCSYAVTADFTQVLKPLGPMEMDHLAELRRKITSNETIVGDAISAVVVAVHMISEFTTLKSGKPGKYTRKIVLLTDGQGVMEDEGLESIAKRINDCEISLVVM
jgi:ATP-dependent DNA helicase 2 subunit 2